MSDFSPSINKIIQARPWLSYDDNANLTFDGVTLNAVAAQFGTPCWVTSASTLKTRARALKRAFAQTTLEIGMHFAIKANDHLAALTLLRQEGFGADVVSGGELARARRAGIKALDIIFSGVGKSDDELRSAIAAQIGSINVESAEELTRLAALATEMNARPRVTLRVNPHIDAETHEKISTGRAGDKFGIDWPTVPALYREAAAHPHLEIIGLAAHIGSQITKIAPFAAACGRLASMVRNLRSEGLIVSHIDCGGGLGIRYNRESPPNIDYYAQMIQTHLGKLDLTISIEPGRWLSGPSGLLISRVIDIKAQEGEKSDFVIIDAAMNDLARPALYHAWHDILPLSLADTAQHDSPQSFVGPVCESGDILAQDRPLPPLRRGDFIAVLDTGAYGHVMSSTYNSRPHAAQIMIESGRMSEIKARQSVEALWAGEVVPQWLEGE